MREDTIAGIATAAGEGGVAIVRVSGPEAVTFFEKVFCPVSKRPPYESHRLMYGRLMDGAERLDEAMGVVMYAPHTYTREDVCEIHTHGGHVAATLALRLLVSLGVRPAEAGEFTRRAFLNGRIDLAQAEAVMSMISAHSAAAFKAGLVQLSGGQSRFITESQTALTTLLAGLEAHIDYPDEIEEAEALQGLDSGLDALIGTLRTAVDERGARIVRDGLRAVLCGSPNAGKSTLFNALLGEDRAIVTEVAGTTRDVLRGEYEWDGLCVHLTDTAGLRDSGDKVEQIGVERARRELEHADVALLLLDSSQPPSTEDEQLLQSPPDCPYAIVLTKADLPAAQQAWEAAALAGVSVITVSAATGQGLSLVRDFLAKHAKVPRQLVLTQERHIAVARDALARLEQAREVLLGGMPLDLAAVDMHDALYLLGRITGESVDERLLDDIFSRFCVGK